MDGLLASSTALPRRFDPLAWHVHEMLFGFALAAVAGFMLTAIPDRTGRVPIRGVRLAALVVLRFFGRVACLISAPIPFRAAALLDLAFPAAPDAAAAREIIAGRSWRNLTMLLPLAVPGAADLLMHLESAGVAVPTGLGLAGIIQLICVVGGRIIPSFTRTCLVRRAAVPWTAAHGPAGRAALGALHAGLLGRVLFPSFWPPGALLLLAAVLNLWRPAHRLGARTLAEPPLMVLHPGYLWVVVGAALPGATMLTDAVPQAAAIHALTAVAIGTMVLAVMARVWLGHTGRPLSAGRPTVLIYSLITLAAGTRIAAAASAFWPLVGVPASLWTASFGLLAVCYGPMLVTPRVDRSGFALVGTARLKQAKGRQAPRKAGAGPAELKTPQRRR